MNLASLTLGVVDVKDFEIQGVGFLETLKAGSVD